MRLRKPSLPWVVLALALLGPTPWVKAQELLLLVKSPIPDSELGASLSAAGDTNGDGYDDILIGAYGDDTVDWDAGAARIVSGIDGSVLVQTFGSKLGDKLGISVAGLGDVDGDGFPDVAISNHRYSGTISGQGMIRVLSGKDGTVIHEILGDVQVLALGSVVARIGDFNSDGFADLLAPTWRYWQTWGQVLGSLRVYSGLDSSRLLDVHGPVGTGFASDAAALGDVNDDNVIDIAVGAPSSNLGATAGGRIHVISGKDGSDIFSVIGGAPNEELGLFIRSAGDVDADGVHDFIAGIPEDTANPGPGRATVFSGKNGIVLHSFTGPHAGSQFGWGVGRAGDYNGDGFGDVIVGARTADLGGGQDSGMAQLFSGKDGTNLSTLFGPPAPTLFGEAVDAIGDTNQDGRIDFAVSAPIAFSNLGAVYIYSGDCSPPIQYGSGCPGSNDFIPALTLGEDCVEAGAPQTFHIDSALGGATAYLALGTGQGNAPIGAGCALLVTPLFPILLPLALSSGGPGAGSAAFGATIPTFLAGKSITLQAFIPDPGAFGGVAASQGLQLIIP